MKALRAKWQSAIYYTKLAMHPLGLSSLVALIAVIVIEFTWPTARHFFGSYPVTLGLIAGLLNLIFTLSVVNREDYLKVLSWIAASAQYAIVIK